MCDRATAPARFCSLLKVQRSHRIDLACPGVSEYLLAEFLSVPARPLKALLNRRKVSQSEPNRFLYQSRPYALLNFQLQPEVVFIAAWHPAEKELVIEFERCSIDGLGRLQSLVDFQCQAWIRPMQQQIQAEAECSLELPISAAKVLPKPLIRSMAERALGLVTERLEKRCRNGLVRGLKRWETRRVKTYDGHPERPS